MSSDSYRDLHDDAYREWEENRADEFAAIQRRAFKAGFEAAAEESQTFRHLRQWLEEERDAAIEQWEEHDDDHQNIRRLAFSEVLVKLHELGCAPEDTDEQDN